MELRQLEVVVAIGEELHFGRAAERVHLSQPALTQSLARLELELGVRLFERTSRRVAPTAAGVEFARRAESVLAELRAAAEATRRIGAGEEGTVRIGAVGTAMLDLLPTLVRAVRAAHPGIRVEPREATGAAQAELLRRGQLDLGLLHVDARDALEGLAVHALRRDRLSLALPADHRLAHRTAVRLQELRDEPLVLLRREVEADTYGRYVEACARAGFAARVEHEVTSLQAQLGLVSAGLGWAFVAEPVVRGLSRSGVAFVALHGGDLWLPTALAWPAAGVSPAADAVRSIAEVLSDDAAAVLG